MGAVGGAELNFDPAGFLKGKSELEVNRYRECELTHGRVGMLASLGFLVQEKFHPLFSADGGPAIDQIPQLPVWLWVVMGSGIAAAESYRINVAFRELDGEKLKAGLPRAGGGQQGHLGHLLGPARLLDEHLRAARRSLSEAGLQTSSHVTASRLVPVRSPVAWVEVVEWVIYLL